MPEDFTNRRKYVRVDHNFMLFFYCKDKKEATYELSQVNNISRGGINFSSFVQYPAGTTLCIELKTPFAEDKIELEGLVLEAREKVEGELYQVRMQFHNVSPQAADILVKIENYGANLT